MKTSVSVLAIVLAVVLQAAVLNRIPLPGGAAPDLVVLAVTAVALYVTRIAGAVTGFAAGLAMDVLPPADHEIGRGALVLCLAGYLIAANRASQKREGLHPYATAAIATLGTALLYAFIGVVLGDPRITFGGVVVGTSLTLLLTMVISPLVLGPLGALLRRASSDPYAEFATPPWTTGGVGR
ncbi:rod shape-determining protein MreD [Nocardiopsis sediminis]|uniref:Rod shape-determining protein MreD n=1 Tax=Nocardiopsis sediminis TaxID=1778267 RepID=A0ABV8FUY7_9ACTN